MNIVILKGRVTKDIELKQTTSGKSVINFSLAVDRPFAKDTTDFFNVTAYDKTAETISRFVGKGREIAIRGSIENREWTDKQGQKRISTEVKCAEFFFCGTKSDGAANYTSDAKSSAQGEKISLAQYIPTAYINDCGGADWIKAGETDENLPF